MRIEHVALNSTLLEHAGAGKKLRDYGEIPLVNQLATAKSVDEMPVCQLTLMENKAHKFLYVAEQVSPSRLFPDDYAFHSSASSRLVSRMETLAHDVARTHDLEKGSNVVEIACNDGYLLQWYAKMGMNAIGVEPAATLAARAERHAGVKVYTEYLNDSVASHIWETHGPATIIHAHNVLAHVPDPVKFLQACKKMLSVYGSLYVEVPWVVPMLKDALFDTVYHEHLYYFSLQTMREMGELAELELVDAVVLPQEHGGSMRVRYRTRGSGAPDAARDSEVPYMEDAEKAWPVLADSFYNRVLDRIHNTRTVLEALHDGNQPLWAYGSSAKGIVFLSQLGDIRKEIEGIGDVSLSKQGRFAYGVPIVPPGVVWANRRIGTVLLLAWNLLDELRPHLISYANAGGQVLLPYLKPQLRKL